MGNQQYNGISSQHIELDHPSAIYLPNDVISGHVLHLKQRQAYILLTGIVHFEKHTKKKVKKCRITFFSSKFDLISSSSIKQNFQLHLDPNLPPSFNNPMIFPHISYSINLICNRIISSIPIHIHPIIRIDQPLLLTPFFFGPIDNRNYGTILQVKLNRSAFTFTDLIQIYYEIQNPNQVNIEKIDISLGVYYLVESNIWQEDISHMPTNSTMIPSKQKLIRHKILLSIPNQITSPPTLQYKHDHRDEQSVFKLTIEYKIQFKIYFPQNLWQVDVPIILCNEIEGLNAIDVQPTSEVNADTI